MSSLFGWVLFVFAPIAVAALSGPAGAAAIDLTSGTTGGLLLNQSFNGETRSADVTLQGVAARQIVSMTVAGIDIRNSSALVGARIYAGGGTLIASANLSVAIGENQNITIPISATLTAGDSYRLAFFVPSSASGNGGDLFDPVPAGPGGFGYVELHGLFQVNGGFQLVGDAFPTTASATSIPRIGVDLEGSAYNLVGFYQRNSQGILSTHVFKAGAAQGCPNFGGPPPTSYIQPCYNPAQSWTNTNGVATAVTDAGPTTWDWNGTTLTGTGLYWTSLFLSNNPNGNVFISHRVNVLGITPGITNTVTSDYQCFENIGIPEICDGASAVFSLWNVVRDDGSYLILANSADIGTCILYGSGPTSGCPADPALLSKTYIVLAAAGAPDTDADGTANGLDNCSLVANPTQCDSDGDGYGNSCDGDLNNNLATNAQDTVLFRQQLGQPSTVPAYNEADLNCNGAVNAQDMTIFRGLLGSPPGPSGWIP